MAIIQYQTAPNIAQAYLQAYQRPAGARDRSQGIKNIFDSIGNQISENDRKRLIASYGNSETPKSLEQVAAEQNYVSTGDLGAMQNYQTRMDNAAYTQSQKEATEAESKIKEQEMASDNLRTVNSEVNKLEGEYKLAKGEYDTIADNSAGKEEARIEMETKKAALDDKMAFKKHLEGKLGYTGQETLETTKPSNITSSNITPSTVSVTAFEHYPGEISTYNNAKLLLDTEENTVPSSNNTLNEENTSTSSEDKTQSPVLDKDSIAVASYDTLVNYKGTLTNDDKLNIIARLKSFGNLSNPSKTKSEADQRIADKNKLIRLGIAPEDLGFINTKVVDPNAKLNTSIKNFKTKVTNYINNSSTVSTKLKGNHKDMAIREILDNVPEGNLTPEEKSKYINEILEGK